MSRHSKKDENECDSDNSELDFFTQPGGTVQSSPSEIEVTSNVSSLDDNSPLDLKLDDDTLMPVYLEAKLTATPVFLQASNSLEHILADFERSSTEFLSQHRQEVGNMFQHNQEPENRTRELIFQNHEACQSIFGIKEPLLNDYSHLSALANKPNPQEHEIKLQSEGKYDVTVPPKNNSEEKQESRYGFIWKRSQSRAKEDTYLEKKLSK